MHTIHGPKPRSSLNSVMGGGLGSSAALAHMLHKKNASTAAAQAAAQAVAEVAAEEEAAAKAAAAEAVAQAAADKAAAQAAADKAAAKAAADEAAAKAAADEAAAKAAADEAAAKAAAAEAAAQAVAEVAAEEEAAAKAAAAEAVAQAAAAEAAAQAAADEAAAQAAAAEAAAQAPAVEAIRASGEPKTPYQTALEALNTRIKTITSADIQSHLSKLIKTTETFKANNTVNLDTLTDALKATLQRLDNHSDVDQKTYLNTAKRMQGSGSRGLRIIGTLMIALAAVIASVFIAAVTAISIPTLAAVLPASSVPILATVAAVAPPASVVAAGVLGTSVVGFFSIKAGQTTGLSKTMFDLNTQLTVENSPVNATP